MTKYGIDVYKGDGTIDWAKVKCSSNGSFAMIKATQGKSIHSIIKRYLFVDNKFRKNLAEAVKNNVPVGVYHYLTAPTVEKAIEEADFYVSTITPYKDDITLYAAVDVEEGTVFGKLAKAELTAIVDAFCERVKAAGFRPIIYTNRDYLTYYLNKDDILAKWDIWQAHWSSNKPNDCGERLKIWQYGSTKVNGISGYVDGNIAYFDFSALDTKKLDTKKKFEAGDKVKIIKGAVYGGASKNTGKAVPKSVCGNTYTIQKLDASRGSEEALIKEIVSWVDTRYLERV